MYIGIEIYDIYQYIVDFILIEYKTYIMMMWIRILHILIELKYNYTSDVKRINNKYKI